MAFIQIIKYRTSRPEEVEKLEAEMQASGRQPLFTRVAVGRDKTDPNLYYTIVEFPDEAAARANNDAPETQAFAAKMMALSDGPPEFMDIDVLRAM